MRGKLSSIQFIKNQQNLFRFLGTSREIGFVNIFMEYVAGGTIERLLNDFGPFEEVIIRNFTAQIVEGVIYIHSKKIAHRLLEYLFLLLKYKLIDDCFSRDIKGRNIMLMQNGVIKLIDFGCAKRFRQFEISNNTKYLLKSIIGTPYWMAPEVITKKGEFCIY